MSTLYIRDVPEEVAAELKLRAARSGTSLSAYVNQELARIAASPSNADLLRSLREEPRASAPTRSEILDALRDSRR
ncbi:antitoxin [Brachybacterium sp. HMSC06H03]|jgi:plasmid stability protein|uniref:FitA-like ribbon-helix-helix domain-containing protein n=1 Tax=Brachybacterium sp. HMSC06H03 TaxID=1581127 RepID=UPI0008A604FB|nr:antitoxin [Brachybacterium sp. HMSC06H03]OFT44356.1 antitoxin [Brachybacterium sp. HMSC06H03]